MAFQLKDFASIVASMLNHMGATSTQITDFNQGAVARTLVEAPAIELDQLYQQMFIGLREAIPVSVFKSFNFSALPATYSSGTVTFTANPVSSTPIVIPQGTAVSVPGGAVKYLTQTTVILPANTASVSVAVLADTIGSVGNVAANTVTSLLGSINGITSVTNAADIADGSDPETDDERQLRFQAYISTLARGTNAAIVYGAKTTQLLNAGGQVIEVVANAVMIEPYLTDTTQPPSVIKCVIHNGVGNTSAALVAQAQNVVNGYVASDGTVVPGWKAAGVICTVVAAIEVPVTVSGAITVLFGYDGPTVAAAALSAAETYLTGLPIGKPALLAEIIAVMMGVPGVYNVSLTSPTADTTIAADHKAMPGTSSALTSTVLTS